VYLERGAAHPESEHRTHRKDTCRGANLVERESGAVLAGRARETTSDDTRRVNLIEEGSGQYKKRNRSV